MFQFRYYSTKKRYTEFQQAWFSHIGQYVDGKPGLGTPSVEKETRTRSGRKVKDVGKSCRVEANECKHLFDSFIRVLPGTCPALHDQQVFIASLAYCVYDEMNDELMSYKRDQLQQDLSHTAIKFEDEEIIHRYLGSAVHNMIENKKKEITAIHKRRPILSSETLSVSLETVNEEIKVLKMMTVDRETAEIQLPVTISSLSNVGLTQISPAMIEYGGCVLLEFRKKCGVQFRKDTPALAKSVINNEKCLTSFALQSLKWT